MNRAVIPTDSPSLSEAMVKFHTVWASNRFCLLLQKLNGRLHACADPKSPWYSRTVESSKWHYQKKMKPQRGLRGFQEATCKITDQPGLASLPADLQALDALPPELRLFSLLKAAFVLPIRITF